MAVELIHRGVEIVLVKRFLGIQTAGLRQPSALRLLSQRQLGAGKEQAAVEDGLEQAALAGRTEVGEEFVEVKARPGVVEDGQAAVVQGLMKLNPTGGKEGLTFEGGGDEIAGGSGQVGDIANGARARPAGSAKGFAHEEGDIGFTVFTGRGGGLNEHGLQNKPCIIN